MAAEQIWYDAREQADVHIRPAIRRGFAPLGVARAIARQSDRWFLWLPVALAGGIAAYLSLPVEPGWPVLLVCIALAVIALRTARAGRSLPYSILFAAFLTGFVAGKVRTEIAGAPSLAASTGQVVIMGWLEGVTPTAARRSRLLIRIDDITEIARHAEPALVQVTLSGRYEFPPLGSYISLPARLYPVATPVAPGGFDYARTLWFRGIGGSGIAFEAPQAVPGQAPRAVWTAPVEAARSAISERISAALPTGTAGFANALITGQRGGIPHEYRDALRSAGLAHVLAISGLHMTIVGGSVFWLLRALFAASPVLAVRRPIKKWAAAGSLLVSAGYLLLAGGSIATQRAFIMLAIMCIAIMLDRPAISLRNLAIAALIVLVLTPEAVVTPGFQMSFLAVAAIVSAYEAVYAWRVRREPLPAGQTHWATTLFKMLVKAVLTLSLTTLVAGLFTGLPAAFHFNRVATYGLMANLLALPVITSVVMPSALAGVLAMPLGLEGVPLAVMGFGLEIVIMIALEVEKLPGSVMTVSAMPTVAGGLLGFGALWVCLWHGWLRALAIVPAMAGMAIMYFEESTPDILVERTGRVVAVRQAMGLLVPSNGRRGRHTIRKWLTAAGDPATPSEAAARAGWACKEKACRADVAGKSVVHLQEGAKLPAGCKDAFIVIAAFPLRKHCRHAKVRIDRFDLWRHGAHALRIAPDGAVSVTTAKAERGNRPWVVSPVATRSIRDDPAGYRSYWQRKNQKRTKRRSNSKKKPAAPVNSGE